MKAFKLFCFIFFTAQLSRGQTVTDIDGNTYQTITIGTQVWMKENLKVTHYKNGDPIPTVTGSAQWNALTTGAYCTYNNTSSSYGNLYNWYVANDSRQVAPEGWHVPTDTEWYTLANFLGDSATSGAFLKEAGNTHWSAPNTGANNSSGFTALPGGYRDVSGTYNHLSMYNNFWSATVNATNPTLVYHRGMAYNHTQVLRYLRAKNFGFSIRCVKNALVTGIIEKTMGEINIYPNPAQDNLTIESPNEGKLQIINMQGGLLNEFLLKAEKNDINLSGLAIGLYTLRIISNDSVITKKMVKQ